jgi:hypothetical protein
MGPARFIRYFPVIVYSSRAIRPHARLIAELSWGNEKWPKLAACFLLYGGWRAVVPSGQGAQPP